MHTNAVSDSTVEITEEVVVVKGKGVWTEYSHIGGSRSHIIIIY